MHRRQTAPRVSSGPRPIWSERIPFARRLTCNPISMSLQSLCFTTATVDGPPPRSTEQTVRARPDSSASTSPSLPRPTRGCPARPPSGPPAARARPARSWGASPPVQAGPGSGRPARSIRTAARPGRGRAAGPVGPLSASPKLHTSDPRLVLVLPFLDPINTAPDRPPRPVHSASHTPCNSPCLQLARLRSRPSRLGT